MNEIPAPYLPDVVNGDPAIQDWGLAYKELAGHIRQQVPAIKHVDLYYGQEQFAGQEEGWIPYRAPAVFLDFRTVEVSNLGGLKQHLLLDIGVYLLHETVQDTNDRSLGQRRAMEFVGLMRDLHRVLHNAQGDHFGPLSRTAMGRADAPPFIYFYQQTYRCVLIDKGAAVQWNYREPGPTPMPVQVVPLAD